MRHSIFYFLLAAVLLSSCGKELNQQPVSQASQSAVFGSEDGLRLYTSSFYSILPDINTPYKTDCGLSDYGATTSVPAYLVPGAWSSRQQSSWSWTDLRNINFFIANCTNPAVPQTTRENYIGLAKFFRAYFYFVKMVNFGDVPWYSAPLDPSDTTLLYKARDPRTLIMDSIIADLDYAAAHITTAAEATRSTITSNIVYGYKSRFCLFEGTYRKYNDVALSSTAPALLQLAADAAQQVISSNTYSLSMGTGSYRNLFISTAPVTSEVMLSNVSSQSLAKTNDANWYFTSATYGVRFNFIRTFINTYLNIDGTRFTDKPGHDTMAFSTETKNRDLRLQQTIRTPGYTRINNGSVQPAPPVFSYTFTGYQPIKWCLDDMYYDQSAVNTNSVCLMRYAEILLNYAEAKAELGTLNAADWTTTIGALRSRAGITGGLNTLPTVADPYLQQHYFPDITNPAILEIRRERGIELCLEGFRWNDLIRWDHGELLLNTWNGMYVPALNVPMDLNADGVPDVCFYTTLPANQVKGVTYINVSADPQKLAGGDHGELNWLDNIQRDWETYKYLNPIAYADLQLNPKLGQNPGWQ